VKYLGYLFWFSLCAIPFVVIYGPIFGISITGNPGYDLGIMVFSAFIIGIIVKLGPPH